MTINNEVIEGALLKVAALHHIHGIACLCGFKSLVSRDRTKHIMDAALEAAAPIIRAEALEAAAANILTNDPLDYWSQHLPEGLGFQEAMSSWLKAHAKAERGWR